MSNKSLVNRHTNTHIPCETAISSATAEFLKRSKTYSSPYHIQEIQRISKKNASVKCLNAFCGWERLLNFPSEQRFVARQ